MDSPDFQRKERQHRRCIFHVVSGARTNLCRKLLGNGCIDNFKNIISGYRARRILAKKPGNLMLKRIVIPLCFFVIAQSAAHADCTAVILASKQRSETVEGSSSLETAARNFCSEYSSAKSSGKSMNAGASYNVLSASFGSSSTSQEQIANRYCDASDMSKARSDAYRIYVESVHPDAYPAYQRCVEMETDGLVINIEPAGVTGKYLVANVSYSSTNANTVHEVVFNAQNSATCKWSTASGSGNAVTLNPNTASSLTCTRTKDTEPTVINIFATTRRNASYTYKWDSYENGLPVGLLQKLTSRVDDAANSLNVVNQSFNSSVVSFATATCPKGWVEYKEAYGRFIRGIDKSGTNIDPDGPRGPGNLQSDQFRSHTHTRPHDVFDAGGLYEGSVPRGNVFGYSYSGAPGAPEGPPTGATGGSETVPKNVALLYCQRKS